MWKEHFKNLLKSSPKVTNKSVTKFINSQLDIKLGQFTEEEFNIVLTKIKSRKAVGINEISLKVYKNKEIWWLFQFCNSVYEQNTIERWEKDCILPFSKNGDLRITKNYRGIILTSIAVKFYNAPLIHCIKSEVEKILRKNQNGFLRNQSTTSQILTICWTIKGVCAKHLEATLVCRFLQGIWFHKRRGNIEQTLLAYGLPKETVKGIMMLYRKMKVKVHSPDGEKNFFDIVAGVLEGDTFAPYSFIICLDYVLQMSMDLIKRKWLYAKKGRKQTISWRNYSRYKLCASCKYTCSSWIPGA